MKKFLMFVSLATLLFAALSNAHNLYAYYWKADNAVVTLSNCKRNYDISGTLSIVP